MKLIVSYIDEALMNRENEEKLNDLKEKVKALCAKFPIPTK